MNRFVANHSIKRFLVMLIFISGFANQSYGLSPSKPAYQNLQPDLSSLGAGTEVSPDEFFLSQAIVLDENRQPLCRVSLAGQADLTPRFATVTPADLEFSKQYNLRLCDENEAAVVRLTSQRAVEKVQTAALPAFVLAGVAICEMTGLVGGVIGGATAAGLYNATGDVPGTIVGTLEGFTRLAGKSRVIRYAAGGPVGFICGSLGDLAGSMGVYFVLEQAKKRGLLPNHPNRAK